MTRINAVTTTMKITGAGAQADRMIGGMRVGDHRPLQIKELRKRWYAEIDRLIGPGACTYKKKSNRRLLRFV
jgi:hypothetical protein